MTKGKEFLHLSPREVQLCHDYSEGPVDPHRPLWEEESNGFMSVSKPLQVHIEEQATFRNPVDGMESLHEGVAASSLQKTD